MKKQRTKTKKMAKKKWQKDLAVVSSKETEKKPKKKEIL